MSSILTNNGAMVALQTLKSINNNLETTQNEIATGKSVATAKDNSAIWAISKVMESDVAGFEQVSDQLSMAGSAVAVAQTAAEEITSRLQDIKALVVAATKEDADFTKIGTDIGNLIEEITGTADASAVDGGIIGAAQFNGVNLLKTDIDGSGAGTDTLNVIGSLDREGAAVTASMISVTSVDFEANLLTDLAAIDVSDSATALTSLDSIEQALTTSINGAASLGAAARRIEGQGDFISKLTDAMKSGIGTLVDADMEEASARLQALQVQQQLGVQSLSIANQAPQSILSLFR